MPTTLKLLKKKIYKGAKISKNKKELVHNKEDNEKDNK